MKKFFFLILSLLSFYASAAPPADGIMHVDTLAVQYYVKYETNAVTGEKDGIYQAFYKKKMLVSGAYKNGKRDGEWKYTGMNDTLMLKGTYADGAKDGTWEYYYSDGKFSCRMEYVRAMRHGSFKSFYRDGTTLFEKTYREDNAEGLATHYYPNGKVEYTETYVFDTLNGAAKKFYDNGNVKEEKYMKGDHRDSIYKYYYEDGTLWEHILYRNGHEYNVIAYNLPNGKPLDCCTLKDGNGIMRFYDKEGRVTQEVTFKDGKRNGPAKYVEEGIPDSDGSYMNDEREGVWNDYYDDGKLYSKIEYKNGLRDGSITYYYKNGKTKETGSYLKGDRTGFWSGYDELGKISAELNYVNDLLDGDAKYYVKGKISQTGKYNKGEKIFVWLTYNTVGVIISNVDFGYSFDVKKKTKEDADEKQPVKKEAPYSITERMPSFPGGEKMMMEFIQKNVTYPQTAKEQGVSGTVYVNFVVESNGEITRLTVLRGAYPALDKEAMRVIKSMPPWSPGSQDGMPVRVSFNLPIKYTLR